MRLLAARRSLRFMFDFQFDQISNEGCLLPDPRRTHQSQFDLAMASQMGGKAMLCG